VSQGATLPGSEVSGTVPRARAGAQPPLTTIPRQDGPIGTSALEPGYPQGSWKANHDRSHSRETSGGAAPSKTPRSSLDGLDAYARDPSATNLASDKRRAAKPKPPAETKPKSGRATTKKPEPGLTGDTEVDFGI
jgi:hypothetical protein